VIIRGHLLEAVWLPEACAVEKLSYSRKERMKWQLR